MKCIRVEIEAEVTKYEVGKNMEDGVERWADVVTKGWINTERLVKIPHEDGEIVCPYISHRRGHLFIEEGDYIIVDKDGTKHVCGEDKVFSRYRKVE